MIIQGGCIALIRRVRRAETYYIFPGGGAEPGESPEEAAIREATEELGVRVELQHLVTVIDWTDIRGQLQQRQYYFRATVTGGKLGAGKGPEMSSKPDSPSGTYEVLRLDVAELSRHDVRPRDVANMVSAGALL